MRSFFVNSRILSAPVVGGFAFLLYAFTGARTIQWQDSAQFTYRITSGTLWNEYGLAMVHPLHFWLGRLMLWIFPGPDPWAVSLTSALGGSLAVGLLFSCVNSMTGKKSAACFGAITLMLAHSFWRFSGLPEVYTLSAALLLAEVAFYLRFLKTEKPSAWWGLFFVNGLALANHNLALFSTAVWGVTFLLWGLRPIADGGGMMKDKAKKISPFLQLLLIGFFWLLGAVPYLLIVLLELKERPFGEVIHSALFGENFKSQVIGMFPEPGILLISLGFMFLSFPGFALPLAWTAAWKRKRGMTPCLMITVLHLVFFLRYNVIDQYTFLIPVYALIALMAGVGFSEVKRQVWRRGAWGLLLLQPLIYAAVPTLAKQSGVLVKHERHKPYRDDYAYLFYPWQMRERSAERLMQDAFSALGEGGGLLAVEDPMAVYAAKWVRMHLNLEEQVEIVHLSQWIRRAPPAGSVWIPARSDAELPEGWEKRGEVWMAFDR